MAKFLKYGLAKGLSVVHDYNANIEQAFRLNDLQRQARLEYEQKAKYYAEKQKKPVAFTEYGRKKLEPFLLGLSNKIAQIKLDDPNWETSIESQTKYNELTDQFLNNPIVAEDMIARKSFETFQQDAVSGQLTDLQKQQEIDKFDAYANQQPGDNIPIYVYRRPEKFDMMADIDQATKLLIETPESEEFTDISKGIYGTRKFWSDPRIKAVATARYHGNVDGYNSRWNLIDPEMQSEFYNNDPIQFVEDAIRNMLPKEQVESKGYTAAGLKRLGIGSGSISSQDYTNRPFMLNIYNKPGSYSDPHIGELIPKAKTKNGDFLNTNAITGLKFTKDFDNPSAVYKSILNKGIRMLVSKDYSEWKRDKAGNSWARIEIMMPADEYEDNLGRLYFSAGTETDINLRRVNLNQNTGYSLTEKTPTTYKEMFGTNKLDFVYFDAWVPLAENDASARIAYDQSWSTEGLRSNVMYGEQPSFPTVPEYTQKALIDGGWTTEQISNAVNAGKLRITP